MIASKGSRFTSRVSPNAILLIVFVLLSLMYSATTPVFEAPDEVWHYHYIRYIAQGHGLPSLENNEHGAYQEAAQPPLYYLLAALVTAPIHDDDMPELLWHNPGFGYQAVGTVNDNKNMLVHTNREGWPWQGFTLALHLARLVAVAFGTLAVFATLGLARQAFPLHPKLALIAAGLVALNPQFVFISGVASNDSAAAALSTAALWSALSQRQRPSLYRALLTGALIGLAWLTKTSTLLLLPLALLAVFKFKISNKPQLFTNLLHMAAMTGAAIAAGGWWYARNAILYGDPLGLGIHVNTPWGRPQPISLVAVLPELPKVYRSFWGAFGWGSIELPAWVYAALGGLVLISLAGWLKAFAHHPTARQWLNSSTAILCLWCGGILAALLRWMTQVGAPHGRLLFPAIGAGAVLLAAGWAAWGHRVKRGASLAALSLLGMLALLSPFAIIRPALLPPSTLPESELYARADKIQMNYGDTIELLAWKLGSPAARPGSLVPVTLCWQALKPMDINYTVFIHFLGQDNLVVGARDTWPGLGRFPTSLWQPRQAFCDVVHARVEPWTPAPAVYAIEVGVYDAQGSGRLELADSSLPVVGQLIVRGVPPPAPQHSTWYDLGGQITLEGYDAPAQAQAGQPFSLTLHWQAQAVPLDNYTVFVHVVDASGQLVAQHDNYPHNGIYPTWAWAKDEAVADAHTFTLPAGSYTFKVGLYQQPSDLRLPVRGQAGPVQNDIITLTTVQVTP